MAITEARAAIAQLTVGGTSTTMDVTGKVEITCALKHSNGSGTVSAAATFDVQYQNSGGSRWISRTFGPIGFGTTAAATEEREVAIPAGAVSVRVVYVAPTGPTGFTLDAEVGMVSF